jgi:FkbM family methyltransferase
MKKKILLIVPHLSTGGLPQVALKRIEALSDNYRVKCVEYSFLSDIYTVQREKISNILGEANLVTLGDDKSKILELIEEYLPDFVWMEEFPEFFMDPRLARKIYGEDRKYRIIETTHDSSFKPSSKIWMPDKFIFVSVHSVLNFYNLGIPYDLIEYPVQKKVKNKEEAQGILGLDPSWKHVVNVGLFTQRKNQGYVFELAKKMEDKKVKFHFLGNQADNFRSYWEPLMKDKPDNCVVWGERKDVDLFLEASDLFIFPSRGDKNNKELNPIAIKEAIEHDVPVLMYNLDVYCGKYDQVENVKFLNGDPEEDSEILMDLLGVRNGMEKLFSFDFNGEDNRITIKYKGDKRFNFNVSIRDLTSKAPMYWFNLPLENPVDYWVIPIPAHVKKFKNNPNFRGFLIEFYDADSSHLVFGREIIVNTDFYPNIPEFKFNPLDCNYINYYEFFVDKCFDSLGLNNLDTVIDIGANVGLFAKYMYSIGSKKVILAEANPYLRESIELHLDEDLSNSVIYMNPVYKEHTEIDFRFSKENSTIGSNVFDTNVGEYAQLTNLISCETITIDDIFRDNNYGRISLFKCDIEGGEYPIFESITDEQISLVDRFMVEFHGNTEGQIDVILEKLERNNFECEIIVYEMGKKTISNKYAKHGVIFANPKSKLDNSIPNFSQNNEQEIILSFFEGEDHRANKFLDIGANDGKSFSNTYALSLLGWDGVCIEPTQKAFLKLQNLYKNNKNIKCINAGISNKTGVVKIHESLDWDVSEAPSGILSTLHIKNKERFNGMNWREAPIIVYNYNDIVDYYGLEKDNYDFINIDVEGHELIVMNEIVNKLKKCRLLCVEKTTDEDNNQKIIQKLYELGFTITHTTVDNYIAKK